MRVGCHSITWGGVTGDATGVTSVKDLVYRVPGDMHRALRDIAAAGYEGVEMFDGNVADLAERPDQLHALLAETGLALVGVYTGANFVYDDALPDELYRVRRAAELARTFGAEQLVVGGGARRATGTPDSDYDRLAAALDTVDDIAREHGLSACYHPHLSTIVEGPDEVEKIFTRSRIGFCPDTAHLAAGGGDPAELIRRFPDRIRHVHLKDLRDGVFLPLGEGDVDFTDVLAAIREVGYDRWLVVELDSYDGDPAEAARISRAFLDRVLLDGART
ncbi:TIM barrel protein [Pseudonocardia petroleophila]|uniref:TIM barrel protein n=1 Tax=Pseudonocardia petroleophila TaxID=37331 RepID=A0A7G7MCM4_9PSEU|nr:sugar phosphate isomerase/epimerase [Pseudonocardia petroleophila]QNG50535.1 TIM barrel protein [Pseudonocardia petroleophila]